MANTVGRRVSTMDAIERPGDYCGPIKGYTGHDGPHWAIRQVPACPSCGGYDEHREGCADIALTTPDSERFEWGTTDHIAASDDPSVSTPQGQL